MNTDQPLYWHQGLFLQRQHFQHADLHHAQRVARLAELTQPYCWGVVSMQVLEMALASRQVALGQLSVRFRDGTLAEYPGNAIIEPRQFELADLSSGPRTLYVGVRRFVSGQRNAGVFESLDRATQAETRYAVTADSERVADHLGDGGDAEMKGMSLVLRLFWDSELPNLGHYELVPIARIEQNGDAARLCARYVPPCINLAASPTLTEMVRELRDEVVGRARQLEVFKQPHQAQRGDFDASQVGFLLALATLSRYGPLLCHYLETPQIHPWQIYGVLRQLTGELSAFSDRCDMLGETADGTALIGPYRHDDLGSLMSSMGMLIAQLLNEITVGPELLVRMQLNDGVLSCELPESFFGKKNRYYLVVRADIDSALLALAVPRDGKLGGPGELNTLISRSLPGVELIHLQVPPQGLPRRVGALYFRIEPLSDAWDGILRERAAALFLPGAPESLLAELVAVRR